METIKITSNHDIIFSENENSASADVKFIICDFDPNANDVSINREKIDNWLQTLLSQPVVGKVITRFDGKKDFSGHNAKIVEEVDDKGNKFKSVEFDTSAFGSFYEVNIEEIDETEYIVAKAKVWKRFKEAYSILKKRAESKKGLKTSWEINVSESHQETINKKNIKVIDNGEFIGHCLLGELVSPAYKSSGILEVASTVTDDEFAIALSQDMFNLAENNIEPEKGGNKNMTKENKKELSALTDNDLYKKVRRAINSITDETYYYIAQLYPYDYKAIAYEWDRDSDEDYVQFTYVVNSDDTVSITGQQDVKLRFVPVEEIKSQVSELENKLSEAEKDIAEAGKSITTLSKEKEDLETKVSELESYKVKVEEMEAAEKEKELASKLDELKSFALEDDLIEASELEENEQLSAIFSSLTLENFESSQEKIEVIKGKKAIAKFKETQASHQETETSETKKNPKVKTDLSTEDEGVLSATEIIKSMLNK